ncbi:MAG: ABC transporter permease [Phycisphaeraceae bacterium]|nr:ABC transporter permease [Phycisphaeraceae bacterium]
MANRDRADSGRIRERALGRRMWLCVLLGALIACFGSLWWTVGTVPDPVSGVRVSRFERGATSEARLAPFSHRADTETPPSGSGRVRAGGWWHFALGTDKLGRSVLVRLLLGGAVSLGVGIGAALMAVVIGTVYGAVAGYAGGRLDSVMMRVVDVIYGLPTVLLVVLLAVASEAWIDEFVSRAKARDGWIQRQAQRELRAEGIRGEPDAEEALALRPEMLERWEAEARAALPERMLSPWERRLFDLGTLAAAIAGVSWLTMARVIRGQVLSLKRRPFVEAARAVGLPTRTIMRRHLLPNLMGPIVVYATLTVPQAILQESFLSFLGIGVRAPMPSWGTMAAEGLSEVNMHGSDWWLLVFPCAALAGTLLALNFVGEGLLHRKDPTRRGT